MAFEIASTAFEYGFPIPVVHTCEGDDLSPLLRWGGEPKNTVTFALIMEDPDAPGGTFCHWIMYNIPADCHELEKIIPIQKNLDNGASQSKNDFGKIGYRGPCPPKGEEHRYFFKIFALRKKLPRESIGDATEFYPAIKDLILDQAEYMGKYYRKT
ncbi:MAG: YbhB/YbcL family Raf kinase inhibitor-like protein [Bacteroidetes bacterium]|nr:MAG: YbhB/YbcL family Raf kinase inhibitor-like protein [Bacteroidota bacterium]